MSAPGARTSQRVVALGRIAAAAGLAALWQVAADGLGPLLVAPPLPVIARLGTILADGSLARHAAATLALALSGFAAGAAAGVAFPVALAFWRRLRVALGPVLRGAMGLPPFALAPLLVLWLGIGAAPKFAIVAIVVFFLTYVATESGIANIDRRLVATARVLGAGAVEVAREVMLRSTLPFVLVGMKTALPRAVGAAIVGEMLVGDRGLGFYITHSREMDDQTGMFAGVVAVAALVLLINAALRRVERGLLAWRPPGADAAV